MYSIFVHNRVETLRAAIDCIRDRRINNQSVDVTSQYEEPKL